MISVVIPLYNKETSILNTVNSVLSQTYTHFELLIVDDGSTDRSVEIVNAIDDERIRVLSKSNGGVSSARNYGVESAKGEYIFFLDADDLISSECLFEFNRLIELYKDEFVFACNFKISEADGIDKIITYGNKESILKNPLKEQWNRNIYMRTGSFLIHKVCIEKIGLFQPQINIYEDLDFTVRLMREFRVVYTPKILMSYEGEYLELSRKILPLSKEFAFYIDLNTCNFHEKLILSQNVYLAYIKRRRLNDVESKKYLLKKNKRHVLFILYAMVLKKMMDWKVAFT